MPCHNMYHWDHTIGGHTISGSECLLFQHLAVVGVVSSSRRLSGCGGAAARRAKAELLRKLERGQQVTSMGKDGIVIMDTVVTVDRFDMTVLVDSCEVLFVDDITVSGNYTMQFQMQFLE